MRTPTHEKGFTLVEMLVAMTIFSLLAIGAVTTLRGSVEVQGAVDRQFEEMNGTQRLRFLFTSDLAQVLDRPSRGGEGERPAFVGTASEMQFVRGGLSSDVGIDLSRVSWQVEGAKLVRRSTRQIDGEGEEIVTTLAEASALEVALRYRRADGGWSEGFSPSYPGERPVAVELSLTSEAMPRILILAELPQGQQPPRGAEGEI